VPPPQGHLLSNCVRAAFRNNRELKDNELLRSEREKAVGRDATGLMSSAWSLQARTHREKFMGMRRPQDCGFAAGTSRDV